MDELNFEVFLLFPVSSYEDLFDTISSEMLNYFTVDVALQITNDGMVANVFTLPAGSLLPHVPSCCSLMQLCTDLRPSTADRCIAKNLMSHTLS